MATGWTLTTMRPGELKPHPVSIEIYGEPDEGLYESVKEHGVLNPPKCLPDGILLGGHRRWVAAKKAKLKEIPVLRRRSGLSPEEQVVEIVEANSTREKTMEQKAREYSKLAEANAALARKRQAHGKTAPGKTLPEAVPEASKGEAKEQAAAEVGLSRKTAEKAREVVVEIDRLKASGESKKAETLRSKLNKESVAEAHEAATGKPRASKSNGKPHHEEPSNELPLDEALAELDTCLKELQRQWPKESLDIMATKLRKFADHIEKSLK